MKKNLLSLLTLWIAFSASLYAGPVSVSDAQNVALNFFKVTTNASTAPTANLVYTKTGTNNSVSFYVFDFSPSKGFVIVAGDDNVIPILAYSTENNFRTNFNHTGVNDWVNQTSARIQLALQHNAIADARIQGQWSAYRQGQNPQTQRSGNAAGPLCMTAWDQENDISTPPPYIYNLFCPYNSVDAQRCLTGCVATAQAQIMKFWNYPAQGMGSFSYIDDTIHGYSANYGVQSSDFSSHTYQWSQMANMLTDATSGVADTAVAVLMYDCAVSVGMDFGDDNQNDSGANGLIAEEIIYGDSFSSQYALVKYFDYDPDTIKGVFRSSYSDSAWIALMEHETDMGRPVLYEGNDASQGGHAWVCDGYNTNDQLHMNWGWSGYSDGYFAITNLTTPGNFNPIEQNDALIGIMPRVIPTGVKTLSNELSFNVFPNPANTQVMLQTNETSNGAIWEFKNIVGQSVLSGSIAGQQTPINVSGLASGMYLIEIHSGQKSMVKKLVISREI